MRRTSIPVVLTLVLAGGQLLPAHDAHEHLSPQDRAAIQRLLRAGSPGSERLLGPLLDDERLRRPTLAALALEGRPPEQAGAVVLERLKGWPRPADRMAALEMLTARPTWARALLVALKAGRLPATDLSSHTARRLADAGGAEARKYLETSWGVLREPTPEKAAEAKRLVGMLADPAAAPPDVARGARLFGKTCAVCHPLHEQGGSLGPDLGPLHRDSHAYLIENIVDPASSIPRAYQMVVVATSDGRLLSGLVRREDEATLVLATPTGDVTIPKGQVDERQTSQQSLMPEGLLRPLAPDEVRDLLAFLRDAPPGWVGMAQGGEGDETSLAVPRTLAESPPQRWALKSGGHVEGAVLRVDGRGVSVARGGGRSRFLGMDELAPESRALLERWQKGQAAPAGFGAPAHRFVIRVVPGTMLYDTTQLAVRPGETVAITLVNPDGMPHNLVVCNVPDGKAADRLALAAFQLGQAGPERDYIPESSEILVAARLAQPRSTSTLFFRAPERPGSYPFVCTLPGHAQKMRGMLHVGVTPTLAGVRYQLFTSGPLKLPVPPTSKPDDEGAAPGGLIDLGVGHPDEKYVVVFTADLLVPRAGRQHFALSSRGRARLLIDGELVVEDSGAFPTAKGVPGEVELAAGRHRLRFEYVKAMSLRYAALTTGPDAAVLSTGAGLQGLGLGAETGMPLSPPPGEAILHRGPIEGAGVRAIGVGYAEGVSLAFDADSLALALMWRGPFLDVARHWSFRGAGDVPPGSAPLALVPAGTRPFAVLPDPESPWPRQDVRGPGQGSDFVGARREPSAYRFLGYRLDDRRRPEFRYRYGDVTIRDLPLPLAGKGFVRRLELEGRPAGPLYFLAAAGDVSHKQGRFYLERGGLRVTGAVPVLRGLQGRRELLVPVTFRDGRASLQVEYELDAPAAHGHGHQEK